MLKPEKPVVWLKGQVIMKADKRKKLEAAGWRIGSTQDFLGLKDEELALVQLKLRLARGVRERRVKAGVTQAEVARRIGSSQSRVAKMEAGDPAVSIDLCIKTLFALGAKLRDIAILVGKTNDRSAAA